MEPNVRLAGIKGYYPVDILFDILGRMAEEEIECTFINRAEQLNKEQIYLYIMGQDVLKNIPGLPLLDGRLVMTNPEGARLKNLKTQRVIVMAANLSLREITYLTQNLEQKFYNPVLQMLKGEKNDETV